MRTTCCTTRSLNRPFVSHPCSRVTACLNYLLCLTTNSIVSRRAEPWFLFKTRIVQLYNRARRAACGVGKHKQITNAASGRRTPGVPFGPGDVQLVGTTVKKLNWVRLTFLWFIAAFCASALSASVEFGKWARLVTSRSLDRLDWLVWGGIFFFFLMFRQLLMPQL